MKCVKLENGYPVDRLAADILDVLVCWVKKVKKINVKINLKVKGQTYLRT